MRLLEDKAIVVTGAGRGIGSAYARAAAAEGARVIVNDIEADHAHAVATEINQRGGTALACQADVSDWGEADGLIATCVEQFGQIDGLVNNAGLFNMELPGEMTEQHLRRLLDVNVIGVAACATAAISHMRTHRAGSIVNVVSGAHFGIPNMAAYAATKGAVASLTYVWALELKDLGIRVNAISPLARTRMSQSTAAFFDRTGLGRIDHEATPPPEANAPLAVYLLADNSHHVTGQIVRIEGSNLSLVAHPAVLDPVLSSDGLWTVEGIAAAFDSTLSARLVPTGMGPLLRAEYHTGSSAFWDGTADSD